MTTGIAEIDHLLTAVADADAAGADFERLGFTVSPPSVIDAMGLANRLVLLTPLTEGAANFIELMCLHDPPRANPAMKELLSGPEGIRSMVMTSFDADATHEALARAGYAPNGVHRLQREWALPSGEVLHLAFDVLLPLPAPFLFNVCRYRTLEHYLRPEWRVHANGARSLVAVHAVAPDPAREMAYYEKLFGKPAEAEPQGGLSISPGAVKLTVVTPEVFRTRFGIDAPRPSGYAGYTIRCDDLAHTRAVLARNGVPFSETGDGLVIAPALARGNVLRFVA